MIQACKQQTNKLLKICFDVLIALKKHSSTLSVESSIMRTYVNVAACGLITEAAVSLKISTNMLVLTQCILGKSP